MKKAARTTERALISRAQQIFSIRRRLAFLREVERRLKEQAAVLDAYKPARRSPSLAVCSSYHASSASQRLVATGPLTGGGMRAVPSPDRSQATSPWAQRPIDSIPADRMRISTRLPRLLVVALSAGSKVSSSASDLRLVAA